MNYESYGFRDVTKIREYLEKNRADVAAGHAPVSLETYDANLKMARAMLDDQLRDMTAHLPCESDKTREILAFIASSLETIKIAIRSGSSPLSQAFFYAGLALSYKLVDILEEKEA